MLLKEIQAWIDIYNKYISKMPLYYMHSKSYHTLFKSIIDKSSILKKVTKYYFNIFYPFIEIKYSKLKIL